VPRAPRPLPTPQHSLNAQEAKAAPLTSPGAWALKCRTERGTGRCATRAAGRALSHGSRTGLARVLAAPQDGRRRLSAPTVRFGSGLAARTTTPFLDSPRMSAYRHHPAPGLAPRAGPRTPRRAEPSQLTAHVGIPTSKRAGAGGPGQRAHVGIPTSKRAGAGLRRAFGETRAGAGAGAGAGTGTGTGTGTFAWGREGQKAKTPREAARGVFRDSVTS
jgi:hypothetical protein